VVDEVVGAPVAAEDEVVGAGQRQAAHLRRLLFRQLRRQPQRTHLLPVPVVGAPVAVVAVEHHAHGVPRAGSNTARPTNS
jgi:hypothetical protein